jgi:ABC-type multidrug transport system fused ATPase/permease subunit
MIIVLSVLGVIALGIFAYIALAISNHLPLQRATAAGVVKALDVMVDQKWIQLKAGKDFNYPDLSGAWLNENPGRGNPAMFIVNEKMSLDLFVENLKGKSGSSLKILEMAKTVGKSYNFVGKISYSGVSILFTCYGVERPFQTKVFKYAHEEADLEKFLTDEGNLVVTSSVNYAVSLEQCDEHCRTDVVTMFKDAVKSSTITEVVVPQEGMTSGSVFEVMFKAASHVIELLPVSYSYHKMSEELINLSYNKVGYRIDGDSYLLPMTAAIEMWTKALKTGQNVIIAGGTGTGKTTLMWHIAEKLQEGFHVIRLRSKDVANLSNESYYQSMKTVLSSMQGNVVFLLDEAQFLKDKHEVEGLLDLLSFMDGNESKTLKTSVLLMFNDTMANLEKIASGALVRPNRAHFLHELHHLVKSRNLFNFIQKEFPLHGDLDALTRIKAPTLAAVWSCFKPKAINDDLKNLIKGYKETK